LGFHRESVYFYFSGCFSLYYILLKKNNKKKREKKEEKDIKKDREHETLYGNGIGRKGQV